MKMCTEGAASLSWYFLDGQFGQKIREPVCGHPSQRAHVLPCGIGAFSGHLLSDYPLVN